MTKKKESKRLVCSKVKCKHTSVFMLLLFYLAVEDLDIKHSAQNNDTVLSPCIYVLNLILNKYMII